MSFYLGARSLSRLEGVHPGLVSVVKRAIELASVDFMVSEGLRDIERQKMLVDTGKSKTMNSQHIRQADGFGHAVDLYPYINGEALYDARDKTPFRVVMRAMFDAASELSVRLRWGNDWNGNGVEVGPDPDESFEDWPHYELKRGTL
jgi:peptidoglycan LD-endopeptidase CwlK